MPTSDKGFDKGTEASDASTMHSGQPLLSPRSRLRTDLVFVCMSLFTFGFGFVASRADWPEFRGPWGNGYVSAPGETKPVGLPLNWSESDNVKWKTAIPYRGWSTPVI